MRDRELETEWRRDLFLTCDGDLKCGEEVLVRGGYPAGDSPSPQSGVGSVVVFAASILSLES